MRVNGPSTPNNPCKISHALNKPLYTYKMIVPDIIEVAFFFSKQRRRSNSVPLIGGPICLSDYGVSTWFFWCKEGAFLA
jgi:hypothetical protein